MNINEMINEWYKGCSHNNAHPIECSECTVSLIKAIDKFAFEGRVAAECKKLINVNGVFGVAMAAGHKAQQLSIFTNQIRARNEYINNR